jgi:pyruvate dehydrogenase complex dehydrogenase (E1) component
VGLKDEFKAVLEAAEQMEHDMVNLPPHYRSGGIEMIDYLEAKLTSEQFQGFCLGNALKYLSRAGKKGDFSEDLAKARWYINRLLDE